MTVTLYPYQEVAAAVIRRKPGVLLADDCGMGKTYTALEPFITNQKGPMLILCRKHSKEWWRHVIREEFESRTCPVVIAGQAGRISESYDLSWIQPGGFGFVICHHEGIRIQYGQKAAPYYTTEWFGVIVDESHWIKSRTSLLGKAVRALGKKAKRRVALSATPRTKFNDDFWGQLAFLYPYAFANYWKFKYKYVEHTPRSWLGFRRPVGSQNTEELATRLRPFTFRRTKESLGIQLPKKTIQYVPLELSAPQRVLYNLVTHSVFLDIDTSRLHDPLYIGSALQRVSTLRQVTSLPALLGEESSPSAVRGIKTSWFKEFLEDFSLTERPLVVFTWYRGTARAVAKLCYPKLEDPPIAIGGETGAIEAFQRGEIPYLVGTYSMLGESLNLQQASTAILFDPWYIGAVVKQAEDRLHRLGQDNPVHIMRLCCRHTIDEDIWEACDEGWTDIQLLYALVKRMQLSVTD